MSKDEEIDDIIDQIEKEHSDRIWLIVGFFIILLGVLCYSMGAVTPQ